MERRESGWTLGELAELFQGQVDGDPNARVFRPSPAGDPDETGLTFAESEKYRERADSVPVGGIIVGSDIARGTASVIQVASPRTAFAQFLGMCARPLPIAHGIHATAVVSDDAWIDPSAQIGAYAVVEAGVRIGANTRIYPHAFVGEDCIIGESVAVYPGAVLYRDVTVGDRSIIHANAVVGADGFGFVWDGTRQQKVPQAGRVEIGSDVEIGAISAVDRATAGATRVGNDVKIDNLCQVAHNVSIGDHTVLAAFVGLAGSSTVGKNVTLAGQTALADHVNVGDGITLGGRTGVTGDLTAPGAYLGYPALPYREAARVLVATNRLPEILRRVRDLEKRLAVYEAAASVPKETE